ncbi:hypothetical protein FEF34_17775 [Streptomyces marianii]|uniref:Uncharacterized protein n=1 Tax=Streptomyces marianii TaxID=1817406 RepID=A0A5R9E4C6_9ACTN|nr:hypothetical protein FEF34_17775 [Streptomyces marianii]
MRTVPRGRGVPLVVLVVAVSALIASLVWVVGADTWRPGPWAMTGAVSREGPVRDFSDAEQAAQRFADRWNLRVGEVMRFSDGYYAQLLDSRGRGATEVLIDPGGGTVHREFGPAMMWNTAYGMMARPVETGSRTIEPGRAVRIADQWLGEHRPGLRAAEPTAFPGYYTLHTLRGDRITGMLSVNSSTGQVWYHTWHGEFLGTSEHPPTPLTP